MSNFGLSEIGQGLFMGVFVINNVVVGFIEIAADIASIIFFRRYTKNKFNLINNIIGHAADGLVLGRNQEDTLSVRGPSNTNTVVRSQNRKIFVANRRLLRATIIFSIFATLANALTFGFTFLIIFVPDNNPVFMICFIIFQSLYLVKHGMNIFFFSFFDKNFRLSLIVEAPCFVFEAGTRHQSSH
jgi:hypothetical protein